MTLRYRILYVGEHVAHLEAENGMIHDIPLEWLPVENREGLLLLVQPENGDAESSTRMMLHEDA